ncbi:hypothetical protein EVAR_63066_1 [Eumeta japonica]|uniref:Uncharacterized protein n=1 Tax=Eumeta variegata TaxID=151549 RepID=A0A4C1Z3P9_EUMVA|nr:hypothetical protein EVAR_63066_1 [Eumeta japonica]
MWRRKRARPQLSEARQLLGIQYLANQKIVFCPMKTVVADSANTAATGAGASHVPRTVVLISPPARHRSFGWRSAQPVDVFREAVQHAERVWRGGDGRVLSI